MNPGPPFNEGGPLALVKTEVSGPDLGITSSSRSNLFSPGNWWQYDGKFVDDGNWGSDSIGNYLSTSIPQITGYDSIAWDKLKPHVAKHGLAQMLYELRDFPRMLSTSANAFHNAWRSFGGGYAKVTMHPRNVADNFLNHEFGWAPFLSDLKGLLSTYWNSTSLLREIVSQNNQWRRKRAVLESTVNQNLVQRIYSPSVLPFGFQIQGLCNDMVVDGITCKGYCDITEVVETKVWAAGTFKFYRPEFDINNPGHGSLLGTLDQLITIYGLRINPSVVYRVTPWTWAIDWFTGFGKFINRLDDFTSDGIVARNLYIMRSMKRYVTKTSYINLASGGRTFVWKREFQTKCRKIADSPYGFDRPFSNLSARQLAILAAVGISQTGSGFISRG